MDAPKIPKALRLKALGYNWMFIFSIGLMIISAWEFSIRLDAMKKPLDMFFRMAEGEGIPLTRAMQYFEWNMLEPLLWLAGCILISLVNLFACRRPIGSMVMLPFCGVLAAYGLMRESSALPDVWFLAQPALLLAIVVFGIVNMSTYRMRQKRLMFNLRRAGDVLRAQDESAPQISDAPQTASMLPSASGRAKLYLNQTAASVYENNERPTYPPPRKRA